jgi:histidinol-phosphatase (PHP family)
MFDFHMHSTVSYDGRGTPRQMAEAAVAAGLKEICFTDHLDYMHRLPRHETAFSREKYAEAYDDLDMPGLLICKGAEVGLTSWNADEISQDLSARAYDFVIGSVHFVNDEDPYFPYFWEGKTVDQAEQIYFEEMLRCVQLHDNFDVLGHLTYISKVRAHPAPRLVSLDRYRDQVAAIMEELIRKGKGIEVNTSGMDRCGAFLPSQEYLRLFKDLGGQIVTVGADAHTPDRVGQYTMDACQMVCDIFGHVCTFAHRQPIFHKL